MIRFRLRLLIILTFFQCHSLLQNYNCFPSSLFEQTFKTHCRKWAKLNKRTLLFISIRLTNTVWLLNWVWLCECVDRVRTGMCTDRPHRCCRLVFIEPRHIRALIRWCLWQNTMCWREDNEDKNRIRLFKIRAISRLKVWTSVWTKVHVFVLLYTFDPVSLAFKLQFRERT